MDTDLLDIEACRKGDTKAYEVLVQRYQKQLVGVAHQMLGDWEDAREAAQDAFVKAYQALDDFDSRKRFSTWLHRILTNTCIDYRRRRSILPAAGGIAPFDLGQKEALNPEENLVANERRRILADAMATLSPRYRAVISLRDLQGLSSREVGEVLGCSEATVRVHLFHARRKLKKALRPVLPSAH